MFEANRIKQWHTPRVLCQVPKSITPKLRKSSWQSLLGVTERSHSYHRWNPSQGQWAGHSICMVNRYSLLQKLHICHIRTRIPAHPLVLLGLSTDIRYHGLYNNPSYPRLLIGSRLWSISGQMHDWRHHYKVFPLCFKMAESFENLDSILNDWAKDKYKKVLSRHWTGTRSIV